MARISHRHMVNSLRHSRTRNSLRVATPFMDLRS
ncbi:unnamed protein product [Anisakis simplex]|uniref:Uncharacterized protein n=1 Tax=Anisakis simplex TaxID=6269 RepID=A0A3P6PG63_ANISI|nr:unnamed protein product [Anisakis simplex]